ncbi:UNVERIFIED_CONTAM: GDSL esterase/lipase [Sesamum latifolium]|uniref:GDSL esterase/lipase n=1 Tax=Sesamum latifolium TaxID=2727402 RepID=A0AAW2SS80_9LAMI
MAFTVDKMRVSAFFLLVLVNLQSSALSAPQVPCFFIFGDSLVDSGNNNDLPTLAKVNYPPYGIDFPKGRPTGRFTNGGTTADFLGELLGFDNYIPPFATAQGNEIIRGVNYASGSAGIRDETGELLGVRINLNNQLKNHNVTISRIAGLLGSGTSEHLNKCLYYFVVGSNDYINNYFVPEYYPTSSMYTPEQYATVLVQQYSQHLKGHRISINEQLLHHNVTVSRIARLLGNTPSRKEHLCKCLYYFVVGSNDYINNYFKPEYYSTSKKYNTKEYAAVLTREYSQQLKKLYSFGARKVAVNGLSGVGCLPEELARGTNGSLCVDALNDAVVLFNHKLQALVQSLNNHLPDAQFVYVPALELSEHIPVPGIKFLVKPCCEVSSTTGLCIRGKAPCPDRSLHLFFDNFHPTSAAYKAAAAAAYAEIVELIQ